jgi:hypothetical protein
MARGTRRGTGGERGVALVEMALVVGILALFLFGIITFGVTLSFDQTLTQASNEAARAAAVAPRDLAVERAQAAAERVLSGWDVGCDDGRGLTCSFVIAPCSNGPSSVTECMTVELRYDLEGHPRVPGILLVDEALPEDLVARVVVEVEPAEPETS